MCPQCKAESGSPCSALAQAVDLHLVTHGGWVLGDPATLHEQLWTPSGPSKHLPAYSASAGDGDKQLQHVQPVGRERQKLACPLSTRRWPVPGGHGWRVVAGEAELCPGRCSRMRRSHLLLPKSLLLPGSPDKRCCGTAGSSPAAWLLSPGAVPSARYEPEPEPVSCFRGKWTLWFALLRLSRWCKLQSGCPHLPAGVHPALKAPQGSKGQSLTPNLSLIQSCLSRAAHFASFFSTAPSLSTLPAHPALLLRLAQGCSPRPLALGPGCVPAALPEPSAALRRLPAGTEQVN